jgi:hypothetical protein
MKKQFLYIFLLAVVISACEHEDENFRYASTDNVYFGLSNLIGVPEDEAEDLYPKGIQDPRKTVYSFAVNQKVRDTVFIPVTLSGKRMAVDRKFKVSVLQDSTTAVSALHYEPLKDFYVLPANEGNMLLPVILFNQDPEMDSQTFHLKLALQSTEDLQASVPEFKYARISVSNRLEKPVWWNNWESELAGYTRVKHALYLIALDNIEDKDLVPNFNGENSFYIPYNLFLIGQFKALLIDPFLWVRDHPDYVLTEREEGIYDFYNVNNTFKKYTLSINEDDGQYYFIDEFGRYVTTDL